MARPKKIDIHAARLWATENVAAHGRGFTTALAAHLSVSRAAAAAVVRRLEAEGFVTRSAAGTRPVFQPGPSRFVVKRYALPGLDESLIWARDFQPYLAVADNVANIVHYGFTEMVNNANDHSQGRSLLIQLSATPQTVFLWVVDDGVGIFKKIAAALQLSDLRLSLLELSKGKFTTDPQRHSGEGIFFTSRVFDSFALTANDLTYTHFYSAADAGNPSPSAPSGASAVERLDDAKPQQAGQGTTVYMAISVTSARQLREVFDLYTTGKPDDLSFDKTTIPVRLAQLGNENLLSRSQAKRLVSRIDRFKVVELDFSGVAEIGQAFADELFRVFASANPDVRLVPTQANQQVMRMITRVRNAP